MIDYTFLLAGLIYATILPGFVVVEFFLPTLAFWKKIPLYLIFSVVVSSYFSYFAALLFGFSRLTLFCCFIIFLFLFIYILITRKIRIGVGLRENWQIILIGLLIYVAFFTALCPAIFRLYNGYFVMGGPNWQDTAMHLSIIESLTQGNFPPQAPYFSGQPLSYYFFSDLHAAIINTLFGKFFPEVLILLNPFLAMTFYFSVFALAYQFTKRKLFSLIAGVAAVLYGNMEFISLVKNLISQHINYITLVTSNPFNSDQNLLQMVPMADYFLQNRPMMVGLPAVVLVVLLLLKNKKFDRNYLSRIFIAGVLTGSLIKFQLFGLIVSWIFFGTYFALQLLMKKIKFKEVIKSLFVFGSPSLLIIFLFNSLKIGSRSLFNMFLDSFSWGPWQKHEPIWFVYFLAGNLGIGFLIFVISFFYKRSWKTAEVLSVYITSLILITVPLIMRFTIYEFDMLKFFYYLIPLICVLLAYFFAQLTHKKFSILIFIIITIFSSLTSINLLFHSYLNKGGGYSYSDYEAGIWIRGNIRQKSVFVTVPSVHSATTDIGGRLRVISYINWPYSHGFNKGTDNVFSRADDVGLVYKTGDIGRVKLKYGARYVFYGAEERSKFPAAGKLFDNNKSLRLIYSQDVIKIYEIL